MYMFASVGAISHLILVAFVLLLGIISVKAQEKAINSKK